MLLFLTCLFSNVLKGPVDITGKDGKKGANGEPGMKGEKGDVGEHGIPVCYLNILMYIII